MVQMTTRIPEALLDDRGRVTAYHSGSVHLLRGSIRPNLHLGTLEQARMRTGRRITRVTAIARPCVRLLDKGENVWRDERLAPVLRRGLEWIVYLNRTEGIPLDEFEAAAAKHPRFDDVSDALFRRLLPSARDSLILLDPYLVISCEAM